MKTTDRTPAFVKLGSLFILLGASFGSLSAAARPKYAPTTTRAIDATDYVRQNPAPDFWAQIFHYVTQAENMCQTSSMVSVFNGLRSGDALDSETKNITQADVLKKVNDPKWERAMKAHHCYSLDNFADIVRKGLKIYFKAPYEVRVVHVDSTEPAAIAKYLEDFVENEKSAQDFIIANFDQAIFTAETESAPHISPVGAYDAKNKRILILDVDREWYTPYWVSQDEFFKSAFTTDQSAKKHRGYLIVSPAK